MKRMKQENEESERRGRLHPSCRVLEDAANLEDPRHPSTLVGYCHHRYQHHLMFDRINARLRSPTILNQKNLRSDTVN